MNTIEKEKMIALLLKKQTYYGLYFYVLMSSIGYLGLKKTDTLASFSNFYLLIMLFGLTLSIVFYNVTKKKHAAIDYLLVFIFQQFPLIIGVFCLMALSIGNLTFLEKYRIAMLIVLYFCLISVYLFVTFAPKIWEMNVKNKKYDFENGFFYLDKNVIQENKKKSFRLINELSPLIILFIITILRLGKGSLDFKFILLGIFSILISFLLLKYYIIPIIYSVVKINLWEKSSKKRCIIVTKEEIDVKP